MSWFAGELVFALKSVAIFLPIVMVANKCFRGNFMGVPTENDIIAFTFVKPPTPTVPKSTDGFAPDEVINKK